jgi:exodeoxyribonuclease V alpha subunit
MPESDIETAGDPSSDPLSGSLSDTSSASESASSSASSSDTLEEALAAGFSQQVARWARTSGAPVDAVDAVSRAARELSARCAGGEVCIELADIPAGRGWPGDARSGRDLLLASGVVGSCSSPGSRPLVLDEFDRLYLNRYFDYECRLARRLQALRSARPDLAGVAARLRERIATLFAENAALLGDELDWQRVAVALGLCEGLAVVSGGPGTGKTTTVVNLLACLIEANPDCRIALAAPTGKAAARMSEAIRERARHLPPGIVERLPADANTVHRLLGMRGSGEPRHGAHEPLPIDVLVVDEASMLDLALATQLLEAVPPGARVVLLGDKDQLAAVEAGSVFADLCRDAYLSAACRERIADLAGIDAGRIVPPSPDPGPMPDGTIWLTRTWRFAPDSRIGQLARLVVEGRTAELSPWIDTDNASDADVQVVDDDPATPNAAVVEAAMQGFAGYKTLLDAGEADPEVLTRAFLQFRVLCAVRDGSRGVDALNAAIGQRMANAGSRPGSDAPAWYVGRPVMVLRNDHTLRLFNGDVGIASRDASGAFVVCFPSGDGGYRSIAPVRLPEHETAFAMTVHKSQGSEFDRVLIVLPHADSRVLTRELLYTAVTRAKKRVTLFASRAALAASVERRTQRRSGLVTRFEDASEAGR